MIKQDLHVLKETEMECRRILEQAQQDRLRILQAAQTEAIKRHKTLLLHERDQCDQRLKFKRDWIATQREERLKHYAEKVRTLQEKAGTHMEDTVNKIYEGMWANGDRPDDMFQPNDS